jgi:uncharacterized protein YhfF
VDGADTSVRALWADYAAGSGTPAPSYRIVRFGDSPALQTELAELVVRGPKRATTSLLRWYATGDEPMPAAGDHGVVVDGTGTARCVVRTTRIDVMPFRDVDAAFAFDEGEGDRTLASWRAMHRAFFAREGAQAGFTFTDELDVVCERFAVVWPAA